MRHGHHLTLFITFSTLLLCSPLLKAEQAESLFTSLLPYADLSTAVYQPRSEAAAVVQRLGYQLTQFQTVSGVEVNVLLATDDNKKQQIIAVRGTSNIENALVNAAIKLTENRHANIVLHDGFAAAAEAVYQTTKPALKQGYQIHTTGHSLGGGIAVILAMLLEQDHYPLGPTITFGQPKVTNLSGAQRYSHLKVIRLVTPQDVVPLVPPLDVADINNLDIYWHLGQEIVLLEKGEFAQLEGISSMMRATRIFDTQLGEKNLEHHRMSLYRQQIISHAKQAKRVDYNPLGNLWGLFGSE